MSEKMQNQQEQIISSQEQSKDPIFQRLASLEKKSIDNIQKNEFEKVKRNLGLICENFDPKKFGELLGNHLNINKVEKNIA